MSVFLEGMKTSFFIEITVDSCLHRRIIPNEPEKFPSVFLEQLVPAFGLLHAGQRPVSSPHRSPLPWGPVLLRLPAQSPPPGQPWSLAPIPSPPPSPPPSLFTRWRYKHPGFSILTSWGSRDVWHSVWPALQFPAGAVGEAPSPSDIWQLGTRAQRLTMWPGWKGRVGNRLRLEWSLHRSWNRDWTEHGYRYWQLMQVFYASFLCCWMRVFSRCCWWWW